MRKPRISLCLIARDEEVFLPGCLASVAGVVDEMVVVDTGSVDSTVEVARQAGAIIVHHVWNDDFSAARNAALPHATGDYILLLDADERLAPGAGVRLKAAIANRKLVLGMLPLHNASRIDAIPAEVLDGTRRIGLPVHVPRLVRRTPDLQWEGIVHEQLRSWLQRHHTEGIVTPVEAPIIHLGGIAEVREAKKKHERNLHLLERMCVLEPDLPNGWVHLASERIRAGDAAGALQASDTAWEAMKRAAKGPGLRPIGVPSASMRAKLAIARGDFQLALDTIDYARTTFGERHPNYGWYAGQAAEALDDLNRAEREYRSSLAMHGLPVAAEIHGGVTNWLSEYALGMILLRTNRPAEALACFDRSLAEKPNQPNVPIGRADALLSLGRPEEALAALEPQLAANSGDGWTLAAEVMCALGDFDTALTFAARGASGKFIESSRLRRRNALHSRLSFHSGRPRVGDGPFGVLGALVARVPEPSVPARVTEEHVAEAVEALLRLGRVDDVETLLEPRSRALVPQIREWVVAALQRHGLAWNEDDEPDLVFVGGADPRRNAEVVAALGGHPRTWQVGRGPSSLFAAWRAIAGEPGDDLDADDAAARGWLIDELGRGAPPDRRLVVAADLRDVEWLATRLPRARFVHVVPPSSEPEHLPTVIELRGKAAALTQRTYELWTEPWVASREAELERVLLFLGEASNGHQAGWTDIGSGFDPIVDWAL
jgi:Glycosyl transferase family 2/Tetratricopeptide repeat